MNEQFTTFYGQKTNSKEMKKLKVAWICHFSNEKIRSRLTFSASPVENFLRNILNKPKALYSDYANWISNGIIEFEKFDNVEMHVISPHYGMKHNIEHFDINGINYWFFKPDDNAFLQRRIKYFTKIRVSEYKRNRKIVKRIIAKINPDIIHMYGAENPYYSITALDIDTVRYPLIVSLQTLLSDEEFKSKTNIPAIQYILRSNIERTIIKKIQYVGSSVNKYREIIWETINPNIIFSKTYLGIAENVLPDKQVKKYDFVYFAASIDKAADLAIEAFARASQKKTSITLNIVGGEPESFKKQLVERINQLGISDKVFFSGRLPTQEDVFKQISRSRFALLPLKLDIIPGTIREAMFLGLPVLTTITHGTPLLNEMRESLLLSKQGDHDALAKNMNKLIESPDLARKLSANALITAKERWSNQRNMTELVETYKAIIDHHKNGKTIPSEIGTINPKAE